MAEPERYDALIIGSGEAGKHIGWTMAQMGHRTAVVERKLIGGSCPNIACLPSKNLGPPSGPRPESHRPMSSEPSPRLRRWRRSSGRPPS